VPSLIPQSARPLPVLPERPAPPDPATGPTPADKALEDQGGEIIPEEFRAKSLPVVENPATSRKDIDVPDARQLNEDPAPLPPPDSPAQVAWKQNLAGLINVELNIFNACARSVRNLVNSLIAELPVDSADIGEGQFSGGKRQPLEVQEPIIALEVYKQVRRNMRDEEKRQEESELEALRALVSRALGPDYKRRLRR
jgi:hypothetical protein